MTVEFGQRVLAYIERADLTPRKLAYKTQIPLRTIKRVIRGKQELSPDDSLKLKVALFVSSDEKEEFILSSRGFTNAQVEGLTGKPMRDLDNVKHAKRKLINSKGRQFGVIRF